MWETVCFVLRELVLGVCVWVWRGQSILCVYVRGDEGGMKAIMYFISIFTGPKWKGTQLLGFHSGDTPVRQKAGQLFL